MHRLNVLPLNDSSAAFHRHYETHFHMADRYVHLHVSPWYKIFCSRERFMNLFLSKCHPIRTPLNSATGHRKGHEAQPSAGEEAPSAHWDGSSQWRFVFSETWDPNFRNHWYTQHSRKEEIWKQPVSNIMATALSVSERDKVIRASYQKRKVQSFLAREVIAIHEDALSSALVPASFNCF